MSHDHAHPTPKRLDAAFAFGVGLNAAFIVVEVVYGLAVNSSALLADAGHNASDVVSLLLAWGAFKLARRKPRGRHTYGWRRTTIYASIVNALLLFGAAGAVGWEAVRQLLDPASVGGATVMAVAGVGVVVNGATAALFMRVGKSDVNVRGAFLHMAADAGVSLGVVLSGAAIYFTAAYWIDPATSFLVVGVVVVGTWRLFVESVNLALDAVPRDVDIDEVRRYLEEREGVEEVHDLHVWAMSSNETALTAHLVAPRVRHDDDFLEAIARDLDERFGVRHTTIQVERSRECAACDLP